MAVAMHLVVVLDYLALVVVVGERAAVSVAATVRARVPDHAMLHSVHFVAVPVAVVAVSEQAAVPVAAAVHVRALQLPAYTDSKKEKIIWK